MTYFFTKIENDAKPYGVLDPEYAHERKIKHELVFRYHVRAKIVYDIICRTIKFKSNLRILDFGCAEGSTLKALQKRIPSGQFTGIEYSGDLLRCHDENQSQILLLQGDVTALPDTISENMYDVVCALAVLEHLSQPEKALAEANRVLKPGGLFIATCPDPRWDKISTRLGLLKDGKHSTDFNKELFYSLAQKENMEVLEYKKFMWSPIAFLPYLGINISPDTSLKIDYFLQKLKIFNFLFVNQCIVARKRVTKDDCT